MPVLLNLTRNSSGDKIPGRISVNVNKPGRTVYIVQYTLHGRSFLHVIDVRLFSQCTNKTMNAVDFYLLLSPLLDTVLPSHP